MKASGPLALVLSVTIFVSASCSKQPVPPPSSSAGALTANSSGNNPEPRRFDRHVLSVSGLHSMTEFIRPEVRSRLDEEPVGDADTGYDPGAVDTGSVGEPEQAHNSEAQTEDGQPNSGPDEDTAPAGSSYPNKFLWAKKSFGDAVKADVASSGVIVLYADENYYDLNALMAFVQDGRNRIANASGIGGDRIQVVYGGYRGVPQVELWLVPDGASMPEFKIEDRSKPDESKN